MPAEIRHASSLFLPCRTPNLFRETGEILPCYPVRKRVECPQVKKDSESDADIHSRDHLLDPILFTNDDDRPGLLEEEIRKISPSPEGASHNLLCRNLF